jgi:VanZ family protein
LFRCNRVYSYVAMKVLKFWLPVAAWMIIIFLFSSRQRIQVSESGPVNFLFFKTLHVLEYAMLYLLSFRAVKYTSREKPRTRWFILAFIITLVYAASDEIHQTFVPTREGHPRDVIIDAVGATIAWISIKRLYPKIPKKLQTWAGRWQLL